MSAYHLSELAKEDLIEIFDYTVRTWGEEQAMSYLDTIEAVIARIAEDPFLLGSKPRDTVVPGCRTFLVAKHVILYRATSMEIGIARILHQAMDLPNQVKEQDFQ